MTNFETFANKLYNLRTSEKLSYVKLAKLIDVTNNAIWKWEHLKAEPTLTNIVNIANYFNVSLDWLCGLNEIKN